MAAQDNLNHQQLKMFMSPTELVDTAWKGDSSVERTGHTPREQWERPDPYDEDAGSLKDKKLREIEERSEDSNYTHHMSKGLPVALHHNAEVYGPRPMLDDGHHRLAYHEARRTPYIPVTHSGR